MSGGCLNYAYRDVREVAKAIEYDESSEWNEHGVDPDRVEWNHSAMLEFLRDLSDLLKAYEWWMSGDTGEKDYREVESAFLEKWPQFQS